MFLTELGKCLVGLGETLQQGSRFPEFSVLLAEFAHAVIDFFQAHGVGIPHRTSTVCGESIAIQVDDVDIDRAQRVSLLKNPCTFVHQGVDTAFDHFGSGNSALEDSSFGGPLSHQGSHLRIGCGTALVVVAIPTCQSLLAVTTHLAKIILSDGLANAGFFQMTIFLANPPADIQSGKIARRQGTHGHTELDKRIVNGFHLRAFFHQELSFPAIGSEHSVSDKAPAVSYQHTDLAELFRKLHASGDDFLARLFSAHNFEQAHDISWTEEVGSNNEFGPRGDAGDVVDAQCGRVARQNSAGFAGAIQILKHLLLKRHTLEDRLHHHLDVAEVVVTESGCDQG